MKLEDLKLVQLSHIDSILRRYLPLKICVPFKGGLSIKLQQLLFDKGCRWYGQPDRQYYDDLWGYFYVDEFGFITCGNCDSDYICLDYNELTIISIFKKMGEYYKIR